MGKNYSDKERDKELPYMPGLVRPTQPGVAFDVGPMRIGELDKFLKKTRSASAPGPNGIQYRVYKKCPMLRKFLFHLIKTAWNQGSGPEQWSMAEGIFIAKILEASDIGDFRVIAKTNVEGKIFFGIIAQRLTRFLLDNGFINTSVQKAGIPGHPGCVEHSAMIWDLIQQSRDEKTDLSVVWLDLANAYGSVPHAAIKFALDFFYIPDHVIGIIEAYLECYKIKFQMLTYTTSDLDVEKGVAAGDTISPLLFVMVKEVVMKAAMRVAESMMCPKVFEVLPPIRAFMDDLTCTQKTTEGMRKLLQRLEELIDWVRMKFKPKKCRALVLRKGKIVPDSFEIGDGRELMLMPSVLEQEVKSLGRLYTAEMSDSDRKKEVQHIVDEGLRKIDEKALQGTLKCWMYQYGLLPRLMWPLVMYEVPITFVEALERRISKY